MNADIAAAGLPDYASAYADASFETSAAVRKSLTETVESVAAYRRLGRWVDIGFGEGALLVEAQTLGWDCAGTEISGASLKFGRSRGWDVTTQSSAWADDSCDVVSLMEILEHVLDPEGLLREAWRLLRPGGVLMATTPNIKSLNFRLLGPRWTIVAPPEHITLFSKGALSRLTQRIPFVRLSLRTTGLNPTELLRRSSTEPTAQERNAGAQQMMKATSGRGGRLVKRIANSVLNALQAGDSLKLLAEKPARTGRPDPLKAGGKSK